MFLTIVGIWLLGMFCTEVVMKVGFRPRLTKLCGDDDLSVPFILFWPFSWLIFTIIRTIISLYTFFDHLTNIIAKKIRLLLSGEYNASKSTGPR